MHNLTPSLTPAPGKSCFCHTVQISFSSSPLVGRLLVSPYSERQKSCSAKKWKYLVQNKLFDLGFLLRSEFQSGLLFVCNYRTEWRHHFCLSLYSLFQLKETNIRDRTQLRYVLRRLAMVCWNMPLYCTLYCKFKTRDYEAIVHFRINAIFVLRTKLL